jgi:hypothetical protein
MKAFVPLHSSKHCRPEATNKINSEFSKEVYTAPLDIRHHFADKLSKLTFTAWHVRVVPSNYCHPENASIVKLCHLPKIYDFRPIWQ